MSAGLSALSKNIDLKEVTFAIYAENLSIFQDRSLERVNDLQINLLHNALDDLISKYEEQNYISSSNHQQNKFSFTQNFLKKYDI